jgi:hypothetical protein
VLTDDDHGFEIVGEFFQCADLHGSEGHSGYLV